jgi:hypothetical protein
LEVLRRLLGRSGGAFGTIGVEGSGSDSDSAPECLGIGGDADAGTACGLPSGPKPPLDQPWQKTSSTGHYGLQIFYRLWEFLALASRAKGGSSGSDSGTPPQELRVASDPEFEKIKKADTDADTGEPMVPELEGLVIETKQRRINSQLPLFLGGGPF